MHSRTHKDLISFKTFSWYPDSFTFGPRCSTWTPLEIWHTSNTVEISSHTCNSISCLSVITAFWVVLFSSSTDENNRTHAHTQRRNLGLGDCSMFSIGNYKPSKSSSNFSTDVSHAILKVTLPYLQYKCSALTCMILYQPTLWQFKLQIRLHGQSTIVCRNIWSKNDNVLRNPRWLVKQNDH